MKFLVKIPLFLSVLVKAYSKYEEFPPHIGILIGLYVDSLMMDNASLMVSISPDKLKEFFMNLAVIMREKNLSALDKSDVVAVREKIRINPPLMC